MLRLHDLCPLETSEATLQADCYGFECTRLRALAHAHRRVRWLSAKKKPVKVYVPGPLRRLIAGCSGCDAPDSVTPASSSRFPVSWTYGDLIAYPEKLSMIKRILLDPLTRGSKCSFASLLCGARRDRSTSVAQCSHKSDAARMDVRTCRVKKRLAKRTPIDLYALRDAQMFEPVPNSDESSPQKRFVPHD